MTPTTNPQKWTQNSTLILPDGRYLYATEDEHKDYNAYSKAWHRTHGPKRTYDNRRVVLMDNAGAQGEVVLRLGGWRGNWQKKAILAAGLTEGEYIAMIAAARLLAA